MSNSPLSPGAQRVGPQPPDARLREFGAPRSPMKGRTATGRVHRANVGCACPSREDRHGALSLQGAGSAAGAVVVAGELSVAVVEVSRRSRPPRRRRRRGRCRNCLRRLERRFSTAHQVVINADHVWSLWSAARTGEPARLLWLGGVRRPSPTAATRAPDSSSHTVAARARSYRDGRRPPDRRAGPSSPRYIPTLQDRYGATLSRRLPRCTTRARQRCQSCSCRPSHRERL